MDNNFGRIAERNLSRLASPWVTPRTRDDKRSCALVTLLRLLPDEASRTLTRAALSKLSWDQGLALFPNKALESWLSQELFELSVACESDSANWLFHLAEEVSDVVNILYELVLRQSEDTLTLAAEYGQIFGELLERVAPRVEFNFLGHLVGTVARAKQDSRVANQLFRTLKGGH